MSSNIEASSKRHRRSISLQNKLHYKLAETTSSTPSLSSASVHHIDKELRRSYSLTAIFLRKNMVGPNELNIKSIDANLELKQQEQQQNIQVKTRGILKTTKTIHDYKVDDKQFRFNEVVYVGEAHSGQEYERKSDFVLHLTPEIAYMIKRELNEFKANEMPVHSESKQFTHFFKINTSSSS